MNEHEHEQARALLAGQGRPVSMVFDISVREAGTTSVYGQTARSMLRAYQLVRQFGFERTQAASFSFGERYTVQDQFIELLLEEGDTLDGCYASFTISNAEPALAKIARYGLKNVFVDFFIGDVAGRVDQARALALCEQLLEALGRLRAMLPAPGKGRGGLPVGEIFINFGDFYEQRALWTSYFAPLFERVRACSVQAVCFEEFRGAALPEDMFEAAAFLRTHFSFDTHFVLAHVHGGNGLEDACNLAAVRGGADGVWASMTPTSALAGHGSSLVYLTNLYRYGNQAVAQQYNMHLADVIVTELYALNHAGQEAMPIEMPVFGRNAYAINFSAFSQNTDLAGMLPAGVVGRQQQARFVPLLCDAASIRQRYTELGCADVPDSTLARLQDAVHRHLLADLNAEADTRIDFNAPEFLLPFAAQRADSSA